jgi:hypothetical protein
MAQNPEEQVAMKQWGQVVARAWSDEAYKQRLLSDPQAVLAEAGLPIPPNLTVQVHEATPTQLHLVLPLPPPGGQREKLTDAELDQVAGGSGELQSHFCLNRTTWGGASCANLPGGGCWG